MSEAIIVGVTDSPSSEAALRWAMQRASALHLPVQLIHAVDDRWAYVGYVEMIRVTGAALLSGARERAAAMAPNVSITTDLVSGGASHALRKSSKKASMIVIGSGHAWVGGSLTDRALQIAAVARCPVAVIGEHDLSDRHGVLVGADGSEESTQAVAFAAAEADRQGQELTVLHAYRAPAPVIRHGVPTGNFVELIEEEERLVLAETVAGLAEKYPDLMVHQVLETSMNPAEALLSAAAASQMLVVGSRGRGSFKRLMLGSTAHAVLTKLPCPTIIAKVSAAKNS